MARSRPRALVAQRSGKIAVNDYRTCQNYLALWKKSPGEGEAPAKECPECHALIATGYSACPECGYEFPPLETSTHEAEASTAGVLAGEVTDEEYEVHDIFYHVHRKRGRAFTTHEGMLDDDPGITAALQAHFDDRPFSITRLGQ